MMLRAFLPTSPLPFRSLVDHRGLTALPLALALLLSACAGTDRAADLPGEARLPRIPSVRGPLDIQVAYPQPGAAKPNADSTFIFGEVGNGRADLTINGDPVEVAPNGAFLAFVPVPADGLYRLRAEVRGASDTLTVSYAAPAVSPSTGNPAVAPALIEFAATQDGIVRSGADTLANGSETAYAMPTPTADRQWFFPRGTRLSVTGRQGRYFRVALTGETEAWVDTASVQIGGTAARGPSASGETMLRPDAGYIDLVIPAGFAPFHVDPQPRMVTVTVYDGTVASGRPAQHIPSDDQMLAGSVRVGGGLDSTTVRVPLAQGLWGFKAFYESDGDLVVRLRRPPAIQPSNLFSGLRIMIDPGHPPGGAIGPTGLTEADANLDISLRLARMLRERGAEVLMTRTSPEPIVSSTSAALELRARVDTAVVTDSDMLVSVHNNAFPDGVNPFENFGTETYYYHAFSEPLAQALLEEIRAVTGLPNLGAKARSLALVRPAWMPSTLTESLFMMFPRQENALRDPDFLERLAAAHLRGIEGFLRAYVESGSL